MSFWDVDAPYVPFLAPGASISGVIDREPIERQSTEFQTGTVKTFANGDPIMLAVITLRTTLRDPANPSDDGLRSLYVDKPAMKAAIVAALRKAGAKKPEAGATLTVTYTGDIPNETKGLNPIKQFSAVYQPGAGLWDEAPAQNGYQAPPAAPQAAYQPPAVPQAPPAPPAAQAAPGSADQVAQIRALLAANLTPAQVAAAVPGWSPAAVQALANIPA